ncbi:MAG: DNA polymerase III subunit gamma/tau [Candidatus Saccharibacteria bacterium]|nr:DNA polymerase III subunit gamma/tau [Candidatus Saccharibacteria bacterium]
MAQALYRKYRSQSLNEIVGQQHITDVLARAIKSGHINHAYLLTGPRGVGKTSIARILAHEINKLPYTSDTNLDIIEIDAASNNGVEDVRDLREKVSIAPVAADKKVYIIDEVHMLSKPAFNALLKTLEEPPEHVVFILATTEVHKLPDTILSRTQRFHFRPIAADDMTTHLAEIAKKEKISIEKDALELIAERAGGSFRDGISLLDQLRNLSDGKITAKMIEETLGLAPIKSVDELIEHIKDRRLGAAVELTDSLEQNGISPVVLVNQLTARLRSKIASNPELIDLIDDLIDVTKSHDPQLKLLAVIAKAASPAETEKPAKSNVALSAPEPTISVKAPEKVIKKVAKNEIAATVVIKQDTNAPKSLDWPALLDNMRTENPPLYAVMQKASVSYDAGTLNIAFGFKLHQKKLEGGRYRQMLTDFLHSKLDFIPTISTSVGKLPASGKGVGAITAIMGGGEEVNVS